MRFWPLGLFLLIFLIGCGSDVSMEPKEPEPMGMGETFGFSHKDGYVGFDINSGQFCFWHNGTKRVFCGDLVEHKWVSGALIEDLEPK